jgi:hypothetical protein
MATAKGKLEDLVNKKMKEGWIKSQMMIKVLAGSEEAAKSALEKHMDRMDKESNSIIYKMDYKDVQKVENPIPNVKEAFSIVVDIEVVTISFEKLFMLVLHYGPSSVEILEPEKLIVDLGDAQGVLNAVADIVHNFAAKTIGGIHINPGKEQEKSD